jgi:hypothetical protein
LTDVGMRDLSTLNSQLSTLKLKAHSARLERWV